MNPIVDRLIPPFVRRAKRHLEKRYRYAGRTRYCPICQRWSSRFVPAGVIPRADAACVWCGSVERHRLAWLYLQRKLPALAEADRTDFLHIAPEAPFAPRFRKAFGEGYVTADLFAANVDVKMDITRIPFPPATFDFIYCSHVLEHVQDDRAAIGEFFRVLKPGAAALLLVPITADRTFEDPSVTDPEERLRLFGQRDHVRRYGPDYQQRLEAPGFTVIKTLPADFLTAVEIERMAITTSAGEIFECRKPLRPVRVADDSVNVKEPPGQ